ncbi:MAG: 3-oxoacyl-ACP reductase FabG [Chlorobi bacterium]|nr:3-oxoacyl-ACP reductase FabG [Chlorobiota bacterium]
MSKLEGSVVIVTGGSRGIGEAIIRRLAHEGATVHATYNASSASADAIAAELTAAGFSVRFHQLDVRDGAACQRFVETVLAESSRIDGLVNNAGITRDTLLLRMSESDWDEVIATNLRSVFTMTKAVLRPMLAQRQGRIVNISSVVGITGNAGQANYAASKAGVIAFTKSAARELASRNILVNCIAPGYIETDMTGKLTDQQRQALLQSVPLGRAGTGDDVAAVVAFLLSEDARYITGQTIAVDGGMVMLP